MARLTRLAVAGQLHHVALRGHSGAALFRDDEDRRVFLDAFGTAARQHGVAVHAYVLLESDAQWLATPPLAEALGRAVQSLGRRYAAAFNRRHGRSGTLWDGRFRSSVLDPGHWLLPATIYIERLPAALEWPWSSAAAHTGQRRDPLLSDHPWYWTLGNTPFERERAHADMLADGVSDAQACALEAALRRGTALGDEAFIDSLERQLARPMRARPRGRPRLH